MSYERRKEVINAKGAVVIYPKNPHQNERRRTPPTIKPTTTRCFFSTTGKELPM
jgi:hypothetical protein